MVAGPPLLQPNENGPLRRKRASRCLPLHCTAKAAHDSPMARGDLLVISRLGMPRETAIIFSPAGSEG